ncbi:ADP-ribosylation factor-like protein 6-interacting protein 1 [Mytilus edulis]|uniref:ADP-ribosylation factor-like protein 6-interacting protein 1 n=1 Tax=Mytilus edulis TaxID=6550 RepID=UPI0039EFED71
MLIINKSEMAEFNDMGNEMEQNKSARLERIKKDLEGWKEVLLPLNGLINWEKPYHPPIIVGLSTFVFFLIWYFQPSILTTFSLIGLAIILIDFLVPMVGPTLMSSRWTGREERQYEDVCIRMLNAKTHFSNFYEAMVDLKTNRPKMYFIIIMGTLISFAWIGCKMDNLLMTYFLLNLIMLVPGIRRNGILQKYFGRLGNAIKSLIQGRVKKLKSN